MELSASSEPIGTACPIFNKTPKSHGLSLFLPYLCTQNWLPVYNSTSSLVPAPSRSLFYSKEEKSPDLWQKFRMFQLFQLFSLLIRAFKAVKIRPL